MKRLIYILLLVAASGVSAADESVYVRTDTARTTDADADYRYYIDLTKKPDANRAVWFGAIVPGLGQIYNHSYWKLPIVYGGLMGCAYAITWTNGKYVDYKQAYLDLYVDNQNGTVSEDASKSYIAVLPKGYDIQRMGGVTTYTTTLQGWQNSYRRYRDISIVATVAVYVLTIIDAYVDAQLFDFDVTPDLSMQVSPLIHRDPMMQHYAGVHLAISF